MNHKKRIDYLDMAKGMGIILMILGHLIGSLQKGDPKPWFSPVFHMITSFHMPLFFIISGMLIHAADHTGRDLSVLLKRRLQTIMLPYAAFSLIYLTLEICTSLFYRQKGLENIPKMLLDTVTLRGISVLWFLPALFLGEMIFLILQKYTGTKNTTILLIITGMAALFISPIFEWAGWQNSFLLILLENCLRVLLRGFLAAMFLMIGGHFYHLTKNNASPAVVGFLTGAFLLSAGCGLSFFNVAVDMNNCVFGNIFLFILCSCCSSIGLILICKNIFHCRLLCFLGRNSLVIMATHLEFKVLAHAADLAYQLLPFIPRAKEAFFFSMIAAFTLLSEAVLVWIFNRFLYLLIGKKK